ncbi:MAG: hypothetical protein ACK5VI_10985, partial [Opitutia bacterium]
SASGAVSGSTSAGGNATGGNATGAGGAATASPNVSQIENSSTSVRGLALSLPAPLNVPQMTGATAACTLSESSGWAVGWNFVSNTGAKQTIDGLCVAERQAAALEAQCKYRSAAVLRAGIAREATRSIPALAELMAEQNVRPWETERDLTVEECFRPKVEKEVVYVDRIVQAPPAPAPVVVTLAQPAPPAPVRPVAPRKPATTACAPICGSNLCATPKVCR